MENNIVALAKEGGGIVVSIILVTMFLRHIKEMRVMLIGQIKTITDQMFTVTEHSTKAIQSLEDTVKNLPCWTSQCQVPALKIVKKVEDENVRLS